MESFVKKQRIFQNLLNMSCEPLIVGKPKQKGLGSRESNIYPTIFSALNHIDENHSVIKINPGLYNQCIVIKKSNIKLQASQISDNSILMNQQFINIVIDLNEPEDKATIQSLKIANASQNGEKHENINEDFESLKNQDYKGFRVGMSMNCCIYIKRGILQVDECKISMAAYHNQEMLTPCIVVEKEGTLILNKSQIRGGEGTIGIFCNNGKVNIKESIIRDHGGIGIFCRGNVQTNFSIKNSSIAKCKEGLVACGPFSGLVESNILSECSVSSMTISQGNKITVLDNEIFKCSTGLQIKNALPLIAKNTIFQSKEWGIECIATNSYLCKARIKYNKINENSRGGILIEGTLNFSQIIGNTCRFNNNFGIRVQRRASPHIFMNQIIKTLGDGVYVCEGSVVFLEKNEINGSLKSNLVLEGPNNIENFIFENTIENARGEGIFSMYAEKYFIKNNRVLNNHNGIVSLTGVMHMQGNQIMHNEANGILLVQDNDGIVNGNKFQGNGKSGIFVRNTSIARIQNNVFEENKYEIVVENDDPIFDKLEETNYFSNTSTIRLPKNYQCQLI